LKEFYLLQATLIELSFGVDIKVIVLNEIGR